MRLFLPNERTQNGEALAISIPSNNSNIEFRLRPWAQLVGGWFQWLWWSVEKWLSTCMRAVLFRGLGRDGGVRVTTLFPICIPYRITKLHSKYHTQRSAYRLLWHPPLLGSSLVALFGQRIFKLFTPPLHCPFLLWSVLCPAARHSVAVGQPPLLSTDQEVDGSCTYCEHGILVHLPLLLLLVHPQFSFVGN